MQMRWKKYVLLPRVAGAATGFAFCFTASSSSSVNAVGDEAAVGVGRDRALNDGREKRSNGVCVTKRIRLNHFPLTCTHFVGLQIDLTYFSV